MPICKSSPAAGTSKKSATDISADHVTEAAQVKRTREQAYFNSYDFDAIEVLPYDEEGDEESTRSGENPSGSAAVNAGITKFAYLQRLGAFFGHKEGATASTSAGGVASTDSGAAAGVVAAGVAAGQSSENFLLPRAMLKYQYQR